MLNIPNWLFWFLVIPATLAYFVIFMAIVMFIIGLFFRK